MRRPNPRLTVRHFGQPGFSLVELLVVITIIGIMVAMLLPAIQATREAARQMQCNQNVKNSSLAAIHHEATFTFFPTGGWNRFWLGHPDRGFDKRQPGGWIYNILPFLEQQALHDLGHPGSGVTIEAANAQRLATPLAALNCPSRRPPALYNLYNGIHGTRFYLTDGCILRLARADYAMNGGDYVQRVRDGSPPRGAPDNLADGDDPAWPWDDMSHQTGVCHQRSQVTMADIQDGASNTFLIGEKYINCNSYETGADWGDNETMYCGDDLDLLRWTGILGAVGTSTRNNLPVRDQSAISSAGVQWFGSAHANGFTMSLCDGSVRMIAYSIDAEIYRRLGNRQDGLLVNSSWF